LRINPWSLGNWLLLKMGLIALKKAYYRTDQFTKKHNLPIPVYFTGRLARSNIMENKRYISSLYSVFDLPHTEECSVKGNDPTRVMMLYDRAMDLRRFEVLNRGFLLKPKI